MTTFKAGDTIKELKPYVKVLLDKYRNLRCDFCFLKKLNLLKCSGCVYMNYCSKECQANDWKIHMKECKLLKKFAPYKPDHWIRFYFYVIQQHIADLKLGNYPEGKMSDMKYNYEKARNDMAEMTHFYYMKKSICKLSNIELLNDIDVMLDLYLKMKTHYIHVYSCRNQLIGYAIYIDMNKLEQNCNPNSASVFFGNTLRLLAIKDIGEEEVTYCYADKLMSSQGRKEMLDRRFRDCECDTCTNCIGDKMKVAKKCFSIGCKGFIADGITSQCEVCLQAPCPTRQDAYQKSGELTVNMLQIVNSICISRRKQSTDPECNTTVYEPKLVTKLVHVYNELTTILDPRNIALMMADRVLYDKAVLGGNRDSMLKYLERMRISLSYEIEKDPYCLSYPGILERILHLKIELYSDLTEEQITKMSEEVIDSYTNLYGSTFEVREDLVYLKRGGMEELQLNNERQIDMLFDLFEIDI